MQHTDTRTVIGLMSGTSLDGVDVAVVRCSGTASTLRASSEVFATITFSDDLRSDLFNVSGGRDSPVSSISGLNARLASTYNDAIRLVCREHDISLDDIDAIGSHGQTIHHDPASGSTLQIGDPAILAHLLGITVVGDFRQADVALGGQGAPLVPYLDWALFSSEEEDRVLLNLGGIANITSLPAGCDRDDVVAFDTGPANMILDGLATRLFDRDYDEGGLLALGGQPDSDIVSKLMEHPFFGQTPPKSTGRELFDSAYIDSFLRETIHLDDDSKMATAALLTSFSVAHALQNFLEGLPAKLIVSGGGLHNQAIMRGLEAQLPSVLVESLAAYGMNPDAKEAICFALLAHEALNGVSTGMPSVTGARGRAFLGKICYSGT